MRISTSQMSDAAAAAISQRQTDLFRTQAQINSGKRIMVSSDDPVGAAQVALSRTALDDTNRWAANQNTAKHSLSLTEATLGNMGDALQNIRETLVAAGSGVYDASQRASLAQELGHRLSELVSIANTDNGGGGFLFSGFKDRILPFTLSGTSVGYAGDQGVRSLEVNSGTKMPVTQNGADDFMNIFNGNGVFSSAATVANGGSGVITVGSVINAALVTGHDYQVVFNAGGTTYDIVDTTTSTTINSNVAYTSGAAITLPGIQVEISRTPSGGDTFAVNASRQTSLFNTVARGIALLGSGNSTWRANELGATLQDIDRALDHINLKRAEAGSHLAQLDDMASAVADRALEHTGEISRLEDVDYAQAATQLAQQNVALQAALATYSKNTKLNLFDYL
jgi:flagellar hook-associated protein 3 FlgL